MSEAALLAAIERGDEVEVEKLLAQGVDPNCQTEDGWPALFLAVDEGMPGVVRALLDHGVDSNSQMQGDPALLVAAFRGHAAIAQLLVERGAHVNVRGSEGDMPLKVAAERGDREMVRLLLEAGADPRSVGGIDGMTALGAAAESGHAEVVQLLLEKGGDVHQRDAYYETALQGVLLKNARAPDERLEKVIRILRQAGAT
ncbi:ankyrin repeat domain-containing protein [Hyalangium sp.]|uniref:ankyrin repeat domain-containing protein n=1 Tax=Hyalangium sp. TaxID=2028555 RepID=UPI002D754438|nr:ankyrin repeat domain-containing protein [Hyalangium sp.]HYH96571.1 ankyrin repeat domain-containing protein [Hyalangium sp.]